MFSYILLLLVEDASLAAKNKMMAKIDKCKAPIPAQFRDAAKSIGGKAASKLATPSAVATKMSQKLPLKMPVEMAQKGMTAEVEAVFVEGTPNDSFWWTDEHCL